jgi:glycosyltransferase involved in cell wall biosynthesis
VFPERGCGSRYRRRVLPLADVSVCIPVHRGEDVLAETIGSVLDQTYRDFEIVVLDNASPDRSGMVARAAGDPRIRVERTATVLPEAECWNRAVQLSRAPLVKLLCADDLLHPRCLEFQVAAMDADPGLAVVASRRHLIDEESRVRVPRRGLSGLTGMRTGVEVARRVVRQGGNPIGEPADVLFRREDFFAAGGWRADRSHILDLDLWMRLLQYGEFLGLPEPLAAVRVIGRPASGDDAERRADQRAALMDELGDSTLFQVRGIDRTVGRLLSPVNRTRRRVLSAVSGAKRVPA